MTVRTRIDAMRNRPLQSDVPIPSPVKRDKVCEDPIVAFLEARIAEKEDHVRRFYVNRTSTMAAVEGEPSPLGQLILDECAMKRSVLASWRAAAGAEGVTRISDAADTVAVSCRSMLRILAAGYEAHPDFREDWFDGRPDTK